MAMRGTVGRAAGLIPEEGAFARRRRHARARACRSCSAAIVSSPLAIPLRPRVARTRLSHCRPGARMQRPRVHPRCILEVRLDRLRDLPHALRAVARVLREEPALVVLPQHLARGSLTVTPMGYLSGTVSILASGLPIWTAVLAALHPCAWPSASARAGAAARQPKRTTARTPFATRAAPSALPRPLLPAPSPTTHTHAARACEAPQGAHTLSARRLFIRSLLAHLHAAVSVAAELDRVRRHAPQVWRWRRGLEGPGARGSRDHRVVVVCVGGRRRARACARRRHAARPPPPPSNAQRVPSKHYPMRILPSKAHVGTPNIFVDIVHHGRLTCCAHAVGAATIKSHFEREAGFTAAGLAFTSHRTTKSDLGGNDWEHANPNLVDRGRAGMV